MTTTDFQLVQAALILEDQTELSLDDLCRACAAQAGRIVELVDEGLLAPAGTAP
ncbi:MAG: transcriptional regulator, MerR family, partial [Polaromonas sp.]|nr:transcriptional regulator, MerR family [Polaromonas sp.]